MNDQRELSQLIAVNLASSFRIIRQSLAQVQNQLQQGDSLGAQIPLLTAHHGINLLETFLKEALGTRLESDEAVNRLTHPSEISRG
jgi:hypothetical protein